MEATISIQGTLLMLDDATPHVAVPVQVVRDGKVIATTLSDERGVYKFINLKPEQYQVRCYTLDGYVYYQKGDILQVERGKIHKDIDFRLPHFKKGIWKNYTYLDGLADSKIMAIYRDPDRRMWFGTFGGGVSVYDRKIFRNLTTQDGLVNNFVHAIYSDPDGILWFGTQGGVSRYDGKEFASFTTEDGLGADSVFAIHSDPDGTLWFGTSKGVSCYDGKEFITFTTEDGLVHNCVRCVHTNPDGTIWFGTDGGISRGTYPELMRRDRKGFVNFTVEDGLVSNVVWSICRNHNGAMWFGTEGGVSQYDGKEFSTLTTEDGLANNDVRCIHCDLDGTLWFGTFGGGVSRYDGIGFVNFAAADGFSNHVFASYRDKDGAMWFGTLNEGVFRYDEKELLTFTTKDGLLSNDVTAIHPSPDGVLWFGTYGGISVYDGKEFVSLTTKDGLVSDWIVAVHCDSDGVMWFGIDSGGISRYDGKEFINFTAEDGLASNDVWAVHCDPDGVMWFGTHDNGVSCYNGKEFTNFTIEDGLSSNWVSAIHCDPEGFIWFGTSAGVSRYDGKEFINLTTEQGLVHSDVISIHHAPDGTLWFGTEGGGVSHYDGEGFVNFTTQDGLSNNKVMAIYDALDGVTWFGTYGGGVAAYDGIAWTSLDTRDGLAGNVVQGIRLDADGYLWFATTEGITRYRRGDIPPQVYIVSVTTDQTYRELDAVPAITVGIRVTIEYNSIDFLTVPEKRQYRCRVYAEKAGERVGEGASKKGNNHASSLPRSPAVAYLSPTRDTTFDWVPDKPGIYIFEVQAINRDLNYSEPAMISLTIQPDPMLVSMQAELSYLRSEFGRKYQFGSIIGNSAAIMQVRGLMEKAIESRLAVLITGETGTGKELVAKAIHHNSPRKDHPLLAVNCGAMPKELLASELFGHRRGAFTGAREDKMGLFEAASGGTVILDEISEMPEDAQVYLLRVLEERLVQRLGEHITRDVDVRVIAVTNKDLMREVSEGRFREDLYYRLSVFPIYIPPLRERIEDIPPLAEHFLKDVEKELDGFAPDVFEVLQSYSWPGNVRELRNAVHRAAALAEGKIQIYHFPHEITGGESLIQDAVAAESGYSEAVKSFQRRFIEQALKECNGNRHEAARRLQMDRANLLRLMKRLDIS